MRNRPSGNEYKIHLNFLGAAREIPDFTVYRRRRLSDIESRPCWSIGGYRLPVTISDEAQWQLYWVTVSNHKGEQLEEFQVTPTMNPYLTCHILFIALHTAARETLPSDGYRLSSEFRKEISFIFHEHAEGFEELVVQPYFLRVKKRFGYLVNFHFKLREEIPFSRKVQQLSLSLDSRFRTNLDYYADRMKKIRGMLSQYNDVFNVLKIPNSSNTIKLSKYFLALPASRLRTKVYQFSGDRGARSQFVGLQKFGPLVPLEHPLRLLFVFREQDRQEARRLALNLRNARSQGKFRFPGFRHLFKHEINIDRSPVVLRSLDYPSIVKTLEYIKRKAGTGDTIVPILVLPKDDDSYMIQKAVFAHNKIATQVCTLPVLRSDNVLKWSIANIALQIFCKAGGIPWKVRPTEAHSLIVGISQSHKLRERNGRRRVEKYFSFSVMTDNSGIFQKIRVLGEGPDEETYIEELENNLKEVLSGGVRDFPRVIIHTSFTLKQSEMNAVERTVRTLAQKSGSSHQFAVVKVNERSNFFGANYATNSLVPYEATSVRLGSGEYLLWFEGIFPDRTTVRKKFAGPVHLKILRVSEGREIPDHHLLQDLVNLSGANWRGFNAKSTPVSIYYCKLVARLVHDFHERGLPMPSLEDIRPWFL